MQLTSETEHWLDRLKLLCAETCGSQLHPFYKSLFDFMAAKTNF